MAHLEEPTPATDEDLSLIAPTLIVARLGEADHRAWWGSNGASPTGAFVLEDRFPRTRRILGLEIALLAAERRHLEEFGEQSDFVHLFSARLGAARLARAWLAERKTEGTEAELVDVLHSRSTHDLEALLPEPDGSSRSVTFGSRSRVGEIAGTDVDDAECRSSIVHRLAHAFLRSEGSLPYVEIARAN
ncbi:MAG TPA: BrxE family protein [Solirubrobacteraceae bacterium]|jgi:hypothetical protein